MATKSFCDKCGEEIIGVITPVKIGVKSYDVCGKCKIALEEFINPPLTPANETQ